MTETSRAALSVAALDARTLPCPLHAILDTLRGADHAAHLVGGCVRDLLRGVPVHDFDVTTSAPLPAILALFPRAIPIGMRHGTVMVPSAAGPVDVTTFRGGRDLQQDLAHRDLTVNAMAWDAREDDVFDPYGGCGDLAERRLRAVGSAAERLAEDPLRALRAARLAAQLDFSVDPELLAAMRDAAPRVAGMARERLGREIEALLCAPAAGAGLRILRDTGIETQLAPGVRDDAPDVVDALPPERALRLAGWLRGTSAEGILLRLRFPRALTLEVTRLLTLHPVERAVRPDRPAAVRRLLRRAGETALPKLVTLRRAELSVHPEGSESAAARASLATLEATLEQLQAEGDLALGRRDLALDGRGVMEILATGPGRHVGNALEFLTERVLEDPACNTRKSLAALLEIWAAEHLPPGGRSRPSEPE